MSHGFTKEEVAEFQAAFNRFDKNKDGHINVQELGDVMKQLGKNLSHEELLGPSVFCSDASCYFNTSFWCQNPGTQWYCQLQSAAAACATADPAQAVRSQPHGPSPNRLLPPTTACNCSCHECAGSRPPLSYNHH